MIRRPPTAITLSARDVAEHFEHMEQEKKRDREKARLRQQERMSGATTSGYRPATVENYQEENCKRQANFPGHEARADPGISFYALDHVDEVFSDEEVRQGTRDDRDLAGRRLNPVPNNGLAFDPCAGSEDEEGFIPVNLPASASFYEENTVMLPPEYHLRPQLPAQPRSEAGPAEIILDESLSFDLSSPATTQVRNVQKLRSRIPLPRSPLFYSRGANSPETRVTSSLAPSMSSHGNPTSLLSQPARRPQSYRPRSESYPYEESERASASYDETQGSGSDNDNEWDGSGAGEEGRSLHEDFQSSPSVPSSLSSPSGDNQASESQIAAEERVFYFSSPRLPLPLPPPFSAVPRNLSTMALLPSVLGEGSPSRSPSISPPRTGVRGLRASPADRSGSPDVHTEQASSSGILHNLASLPFRLLEAYRHRSSSSSPPDRSGSESTPSTRRRTRTRQAPHPDLLILPRPSPGSDQFVIYDDNQPASEQPQTPQHLPEARHQSQFHPSYTAPAGPSTRLGRIGIPGLPGSSSLSRPGWVPNRRTRSDSPVGLQTPGFLGLYGGQENADDEVTFTRAARRLRFLEGAGGRRRRSMSSTPGREL